MTVSRSMIIGSALPLLILLGFTGVPVARAALALAEGESPVPAVDSRPVAAPETPSAAERVDEAAGLRLLRRSVTAGAGLAFAGTEIVSEWHSGGSTSRVLELEQRDGVRTVRTRDTAAGDGQTVGLRAEGDGLAGLTDRALAALASGYTLRTAGTDQVAGRKADVVVVTRSGREAARIWLDHSTGLLLRQDLTDADGRLRRTAAFVDLELADPPGAAGPATTTTAGGGGAAGATAVSETELAALRQKGWPCLQWLPEGFTLLDARREPEAGPDVLHLTYGDGLSAISVFLQPGKLDHDRLSGLRTKRWGKTEVHVRSGWPEVLVWQGGPTVITVVWDGDPAQLERVVAALPRQRGDGSFAGLSERMGSALTWLRD